MEGVGLVPASLVGIFLPGLWKDTDSKSVGRGPVWVPRERCLKECFWSQPAVGCRVEGEVRALLGISSTLGAALPEPQTSPGDDPHGDPGTMFTECLMILLC